MEKISVPEGFKNPFNFCILLTNEPLYWTETKKKTLDKSFRLDQKKLLQGELTYKDIKVYLKGSYCLNWGNLSRHKNFKYLVEKIKPLGE